VRNVLYILMFVLKVALGFLHCPCALKVLWFFVCWQETPLAAKCCM